MKRFLIIALMIMLSTSAWSRDDSDGCGVANGVNGDKSWLGITLRGTTRMSYSGTLDWTGTTSGKFGCAKHSIVYRDKMPVHFMNVNRENLLIDISQGRGEYLQAFARTMGCSDVAVPKLGKVLQNHVEELITTDSKGAGMILKKVRSTFKTDQLLNSNCRSV